MQDPGVASIVSELTSNECGKQFYLTDVDISSSPSYGQLRNVAGDSQLLLGIRRDNTNHLLPDKDFPLAAGDKAILIAAARPA